MGQGSKAALDLFTGLPPWVQTAVLTGWGLNKLTGGALGTIFTTLSTGLIKGVLGMNAGVVNINAGVVNGGAPTPTGPNVPGGGSPLLGLGLGPLALAAATIGAVAAGAAFALSPDRSPGFGTFNGRGGTGRDFLSGSNQINTSIQNLMTADREGYAGLTSEFKRSRATAAQLYNLQQTEASRRSADAARTLGTMTSQLNRLDTLSHKNFSPTINVRTQSNLYIAGRTVQAIITQQQLKVGTGPQEF